MGARANSRLDARAACLFVGNQGSGFRLQSLGLTVLEMVAERRQAASLIAADPASDIGGFWVREFCLGALALKPKPRTRGRPAAPNPKP